MQNVFTYSATKGAVIAMSRQAAITLAPKKIRVNVICPGIIETPILGDITPELKAYCESMTPLARIGTPLDIGAMAVHFARDEVLVHHRSGHRNRRRLDRAVVQDRRPDDGRHLTRGVGRRRVRVRHGRAGLIRPPGR